MKIANTDVSDKDCEPAQLDMFRLKNCMLYGISENDQWSDSNLRELLVVNKIADTDVPDKKVWNYWIGLAFTV